MSRIQVSIFISLIMLLSTSPAWAVKISVVGAGSFTNERDNAPVSVPPTKTSSVFGIGGGAIADFNIDTGWDFEIGGLYVKRAWKKAVGPADVIDATTGNVIASGGSVETTNSFYMFQIPILLRYWLGDNISFGAGPYISKYMGNVKSEARILQSNGTEVSNTKSSTSFSSANLKTSDYGLIFSLGLNFSLSSDMALVIDARYTFDLRNNMVDPTLGYATKFNDIQALLGLQFTL